MTALKIDFVSDVSCPWCAMGLNALETRAGGTRPDLDAELHFQPFELNPTMPAGAAGHGEHLSDKYGITPEQSARNRPRSASAVPRWASRSARAGACGTPSMRTGCCTGPGCEGESTRAEECAAQGLLTATAAILARTTCWLALAGALGLDAEAAREVLESGRYADEVRAAEAMCQEAGIHAVPAIIINDRHLIRAGSRPMCSSARCARSPPRRRKPVRPRAGSAR